MHTDTPVRSVSLPSESRAALFYATTELADVCAIRLPADASTDPEVLARFIFAQPSPLVTPLVTPLLRLRDALVAAFGIKTSRQMSSPPGRRDKTRVGIFKIYETLADEILLGEDDKHLDYRLSVLRRPTTPAPRGPADLILSTVVHCQNRLGRVCILLIAPFHRAIVQSTLRRAARAGWPRQASAGCGTAA